MRKRRYIVTYLVKYSEEWCADECNWIEDAQTVVADTAVKARREYRRQNEHRTKFIIGRHVSTRRY